MTGIQDDGPHWKRPTGEPDAAARIRPPFRQPVLPQHIHDYDTDGLRCIYCGLTQGQLGLNTAWLEEVMCQA